MTRLSSVVALVFVLGAVGAMARGQQGSGSVSTHIAAARQAAGADHVSVFNDLCGPFDPERTPPPAAARGRGAASQAAASPAPAAATPAWHVEPMKVFD